MADREAEEIEQEALVARLQAGDEAAFETLVREHAGRLLPVAKRLLKNDDDASDAVQDAFLSAFKAIGRFETRARLSTWLHRIVVNSALMKLRSKRRRPETSIESLLPRFKEDGHHFDPPAPWRPTTEVERAELREIVRAAIDRLPDSYRTVLLLRDIEQLDTEETATILGVTPNAVKIRLHRARLALRGLLDPSLRE